MALLTATGRGQQVDIPAGDQGGALGADEVAAPEVEIASGDHCDGLAGQRGPRGHGLVEAIAGGGGLAS